MGWFDFMKKKHRDEAQARKSSKAPRPAGRAKSLFLPLEQRLMFDAAAAATTAEVASEQVAQEQAETAVSGGDGEPIAAETESQDLLQALASYSPGESTTEVVFVDPTVPNYQELLSGMDPNVEVIMLDSGQDGVEQIAAALSGRTGIDAIHIISHGTEGRLNLGTGTLTQESMTGQYADELATIQQALSEQADILVYGCNFAEGQAGQDAVTLLSQLTGADVAASTDATGFTGLGGDWVLESQTGSIETQVVVSDDVQMDWVGLLDISTGLVADWTFDSNANDASGNGNNGTLVGNATIDTTTSTNIVGTGKLSLDGVDDYVDLTSRTSSFSGLTQGTIAAWVKLTATGERTIFDIGDGAGNANYVSVFVNNGKLTVAIMDGGTTILNMASIASVNDGNWHHVAFTVDGSGNQLYIDGVAAARTFTTGSAATTAFISALNSKTNTTIGAYNNGAINGEFLGTLDDVRVYSRALTSGDMAQLYATSNDAPINVVPGAQATSEDTNLVFSSGNGNQISISDPDSSGSSFEVMLSVTNGTFTLAGTTGLTFVTGDGTADSTMTVRGTVTNINNALNGASFSPTADYSGGAALTIATRDSTLLSLDLDANLQARYTFEGNANDVAPGTAQNGTLTNGATYVTDGTRGQVLSLDGVNDFVDLSAHTGTFATYTQGTISGWIKSTSTFETIFSISDTADSGSYAALFIGASGYLTYEVMENGVMQLAVYKSDVAINDGNWHHVAVSIGTTGNVLYVDGVAATSGQLTYDTGSASTQRFFSSVSGLDSMAIGRNQDSFGGKWYTTGQLDDVRLYNRVLSTTEVANLANDLALTDTDTVAVTVNAANDAPVLADTALTLTVAEDAGVPSGAVGSLISAFTGGITEPDGGSTKGIAITGSNETNGTWYYTTDGGTTWLTVGSVSDTSALLLADNASTRLYFAPSTNYNGTVTNAITFYAWDQTSGTAGTKVSTATNGGTTAFSSATDTVDVTVSAVNDAPTDLALSANTVAENAANGTVIGSASTTDPDAGDIHTYQLTDDAGGRFAIDTNTGQITVANSSLLDYESAMIHSVTVRVTDAGGLTYDETFTITVTNMNEAPTGADATITLAEDTTHTLTTANFGFSDVDAGDSLSAVWIDTVPGAGTLTLSGASVTAGQVITVADLTAGNLVFTPAANASGTGYASFSFSVRDAGNMYDATPNTLTFDVTAVNDAPINNVPGAQSTNEDTTLVFSSGNGNQIAIADPDASGGTFEVTISVTNGTLTLAGTTGLTFVTGDGTADTTMTVRGTVTDINNALSGASFTTTGNYNGSSTLTIATQDTTLVSLDLDANLQARYTFEGNATDVAPGTAQNGTLNGNATYVMDATRGQVLSLDGVDDSVQISGHFGDPANVTLAAWVKLTTADTQGAEVITLGDSAGIRLDDQGRLFGFMWNGSSWEFTTYDVTLAGTGWHHVAYSFNDAANTGMLYLDGVQVASSTSTNSIVYTATTDANINADSFIGRHASSTSYDFNGLIDDARVYSRALSAAEIATLASDLSLTDTDTVAITVNAVNDAPVLADTALSLTVAEDAGVPSGAVGSVVSAFTGGITDADSGASKGIAITGSNETNGTWYYTTNGGTTWTAVGTVSDTSALLLADNGSTRLYFAPNADYNGTSTAALTVRAWDQTSGTVGTKVSTVSNGGTTAFSSATDTVDVTVSAVNDAPTDLVLSSNTVAENAASGTVVGMVSGTDPDSGDTKTYSLTDAAGGRFAVNSSTGAITVANSSLLDYEAATSHSVTVQVTDSGGLTYDETFTITVTNMNEAPTGADATITLAEDTTHTLTTANFGFSDVDAGDSLSAVRIDTVPSAGSLTLSGVAVTAGQVIAVSDLTAGQLVFTPAADATGTGYTSFTFSVRDSTSTYDSAPNVLTINVTAVNDAPVMATNDGLTVSEAGSVVVSPKFLSVTDVDNRDSELMFMVTTLPVNGTLLLNRVPLSLKDIFTQADIDREMLEYVHDGSESTVDSFAFVVEDGSGGAIAESTFKISITPINDTPTDLSLSANTVTENASNGTVVGTITGTDPDTGDTKTYSFTDSAGGRFAIQSSTGVITVADGSLLDYESATSHNVTVRVTDSGGLTYDETFTITVTNMNEAPTGADATITLAEDTTHTLTTANFGFSDVDAGDSLSAVRIDTVPSAGSLTLSGVAVTAGQVIAVAEISAGNLAFTPAADATGTGYASFTFSVRDSASSYDAAPNTLTFDVTPVNDAPVNTVPGAQTVNEDTALALSGLSVADVDGNLSTVQLGVGNGTLSVTLQGTATISAGSNGTGSLTLAGSQADLNGTLATLIYQGSAHFNGSDTLTVTSTDSNSLTDVDTVAITVTPQNDAPTLSANTGSTAAEGGTDTITASELAVTDVDNSAAQLTYLIGTGPTYGRLELTTAPGISATTFTQADIAANRLVYVHDGSESTGDTFTFTVSDGAGGLLGATNVTLTIAPVNDAPTIVSNGGGATAAINVAEHVSAVTIVGAVDVDLPAQTLTYSVSGGIDQARFTIDAVTGALEFLVSPDFEVPTDADGDNVYVVEVRVTDSQGATATQTLHVMVTDVYESSPPAALPPSLVPTPPPAVSSPTPAAAPPTPDATAPVVKPVAPDARVSSGEAGVRPAQQSSGSGAFRPEELRSNAAVTQRENSEGRPIDQSPTGFLTFSVEDTHIEEREKPLSPAVLSELLFAKLDAVIEELEEAVAADVAEQVHVTRIAAATGVTLSVGFVAWALRSTVLLASLFGTLPAWQTIDPLPVLASHRSERTKHKRVQEYVEREEQAEYRGLHELLDRKGERLPGSGEA